MSEGSSPRRGDPPRDDPGCATRSRPARAGRRGADRLNRDARRSPTLAALLGGALALLALGSTTAAATPPPSFDVALAVSPGSGPAPLPVQFSLGVSSGVVTLVQWTFGDGSFANLSGSAAGSALHTYGAGNFTARVVVWEGSADERGTAWIAAGSGLLELRANVTPSTSVVDTNLTLASQASGGSGSYLGTAWSFGDGSGATGSPVSHAYAVPGVYVAVATVTDTQGRSANASVLVNVSLRSDTLLPGPPAPAWEVYGVAAGLGAAAFAGVLLYRRERPPSEPPPGVYAGPPGEPEGAELEAAGPAAPPADGAPEASFGAPVPVAPGDGRAVSREVVLQLYRLGRVLPDELPTTSRTQRGLVEELGVPQNVLSNVVRRLEAAGVLTARVEHVQGRDRRVKAYYLTTAGERLARSLTRAARPPPG